MQEKHVVIIWLLRCVSFLRFVALVGLVVSDFVKAV
jgi:hypothetical protein